jgi:hypothetical protein
LDGLAGAKLSTDTSPVPALLLFWAFIWARMLVPATHISAKVITTTALFLFQLCAVSLLFTRESFFDIVSPFKVTNLPSRIACFGDPAIVFSPIRGLTSRQTLPLKAASAIYSATEKLEGRIKQE